MSFAWKILHDLCPEKLRFDFTEISIIYLAYQWIFLKLCRNMQSEASIFLVSKTKQISLTTFGNTRLKTLESILLNYGTHSLHIGRAA